jgi:putative membrane protein
MSQPHDTSPAIWKGITAGVIGALAGGWAMTQFHVLLYGRGVTGTREPQSHRPVDGDDDAATKAAEIVAREIAGHGLTKREKQAAAPAVHYAFSAFVGAIYGAAIELAPAARAGRGTAFGAVVWLVADEVALPLLRLAKGPAAYPLSTHAEMLAAHLVFGWTTDAVTCGVRQQFRQPMAR